MRVRGRARGALGLLASGLLAVAVVGAATAPAYAKGGHRVSDPPCTVNPSSVSVGGTFTVSVSGIPANEPMNVDESYADATIVLYVVSDASGSLSVSDQALEAGTVGVKIVDVGGNKFVTVSTCSFTAT